MNKPKSNNKKKESKDLKINTSFDEALKVLTTKDKKKKK